MKKSARLSFVLLFLTPFLFAQGTQTWQQRTYEDFSKGTTKGIAVRSDGTLSLAPGFDAIYTSPSTYIWSAVSQTDGTIFIGAGSPARVYRVTTDGKASVIFEPKELGVQALALDKDGSVYAATSPDGKIYKLTRGQNDSEYTASTYFDPKTKYIWSLALDKDGRLYVGTGDRGEIFRVTKNKDGSADGSVFFKSDEAHIRALVFNAAGDLIAGSDGSGLIYRISPAGDGFVLYSAPKKEITALALDAQGDIFAASVGEKSHISPGQASPILAALGPGINVIPAMVGPNSIAAAGGSDVYMITPDGAPTRLWATKDDIVYALAFDSQQHLLAGTGNKGRIVSIEKDGTFSDLVKASATQITAFAPAPKGALYAASSNLGKVFRLSANTDSEGSYESDVFDAHNFSRWGRMKVRGSGNFQLFTRSGNVDNPDRNWSAWKPVPAGPDLSYQGGRVQAPSARFVQWKIVIPPHSDAVLDDVMVNYLSKNVAPVVDEIVVETGARFNSNNIIKPPNDTVAVNLSSQPQGMTTGISPKFEQPMMAQKDKTGIAVRWAAHDDNDDDLTYSLYTKGDEEKEWKLLKSGITDKSYSFDAALLPDGGYTLRVVASDSPSHTPDDALSGEKVSPRFEVDTTPPVVDALTGKVEGDKVHVTFTAHDTFSPIKRAEYSIDAGDWQYVEPIGQISDSPTEKYDFGAPIPHSSDKFAAAPSEHTIVVRAYDRFDNMGSAKVVIK